MGRGRGDCPGHCGHGDPLIDCPKLDDLALLEALTSDALYVGAIGSLCKWGLLKSSSNQAVDQMLLASCQKVAIRFDFSGGLKPQRLQIQASDLGIALTAP